MPRIILIFAVQLSIVFEVMNTTAAKKSRYIVNTPNCRILDFDPYDRSIRELIRKWAPLNCSSLPLLTTVTGNYRGKLGMNPSHTLHLHKLHLPLYHIPKDGFRCCYRLITRVTTATIRGENYPDDGYSFSDCIDFHNHVTFYGSEEFIWVKCNALVASALRQPYVNMHAFVGNKNEALLKMKAHGRNEGKLSVMIIGFDAMSRLNLIRTMPETVKYLKEIGWYEMKGFNKMGDNTFPNLMAALSGVRVGKNGQSCEPSRRFMDECPIIWKDFSNAGYVTAYGEDDPFIGSFNYLKKGFSQTPTDYYMRPFFLAGFWNTELQYLSGRVGCFGPTKVADHVFNYALDFTSRFRGHPSFSVFWQNGFSHENVNIPSAFDKTALAFFKKLTSTGVLNTTVILFLSDHGIRQGEIRQTFLGYLEERLPFLHISLPKWFRKAHRNNIKNLMKNRNRLISHFDVYMTLADILGKNLTASGCPHCTSLFKLVPWNRSCTDAGIQDHWCTCAEYKDVSVTSPLAMKIADMVVDVINLKLERYAGFISKGTRCAKLRWSMVISLMKKTSNDQNDSSQMVVVIQTTPGGGRFEATVSYEGGLRVLDGISRTNKYGDQGNCVQHTTARKFCFCQNIINN